MKFNKLKEQQALLKEFGEVFAQEAKDGALIAANQAAIKGGQLAEQAKKAKVGLDKAILKPVTREELELFKGNQAQMIRIVDTKKYMEKEAFLGAVGFETIVKGASVLNLYRGNVDSLGIKFYPDIQGEIYYTHPYEIGSYINIGEYFSFIKRGKVNELETIAHKLGARHVKITLKEEKKAFISNSADVKGGFKLGKKKSPELNATHRFDLTNYCNLEVATDVSFDGNSFPTVPELLFYKNDSDIKSLINMRMSEINPISRKTYILKYYDNQGMKESDAVKVDAALKVFKMAGNASFSSEVQTEKRIYMEYEIEF